MVHVHGWKEPIDLLSPGKMCVVDDFSARAIHTHTNSNGQKKQQQQKQQTLYHSNASLKKHEIFMQEMK